MTKQEILERVATVRVWYHTIDLGHGVVTPGFYDMRPYLARYDFPATMSGQDVLDVGASNGFFAFHFESLGARKVVATNLASYLDHDYPRWFRKELEAQKTDEQRAAADWHESVGGFEVARACLGSSVEHVLTRIYDLPHSVGGGVVRLGVLRVPPGASARSRCRAGGRS